ncbi:MAG TPA: grasp-with-spasm system ATP-grasp peptide maturase [Longimicrobiaceae bacterium]|jgi:ATP-GRASP peptide maturase of grasp-with-spasm system|nr:grasp-with-spasm system ATP-grasp peptide maturase [Longimicrobiaceae bacterium]
MIVLLSQQDYEHSTEDVLDWIAALGGHAVRLNGEDVNEDDPFVLECTADGVRGELSLGGVPVRTGEAAAVWLRRTHALHNVEFAAGVEPPSAGRMLRGYLLTELRATHRALHAALAGTPWLTRPWQTDVDKLHTLTLAARAGLEVPATIVTNDRARLAEFKARHGRVITKSVGNAVSFALEDGRYPLYTAELSDEDVAAAPERFFPSLVQEMAEKAFEVRCFYLDGRCWSMAIFSQLDAQTAVDFRRYNDERPNRTVPYLLPPEVESAVCSLMRSIPLDTGSLDLVCTPEGRHVFLEVNPVGQFGMVSAPCNYFLEREVARSLISRASS